MKSNLADQKERVAGLDLIRSCAIFFVMAGHFFVLYTPFWEARLDSLSIFLQAFALQLFYTSVPLFLLLTGYLNVGKTPSRKYYHGIWRVLAAYLFFSVVTILVRKYWLHEDASIFRWGYSILNYTAIPYAWYIEMWIGLFLLTPFLNILYKAVTTRRQKQLLILTMFALTIVPQSWIHVFPAYWRECFPLFYYFFGCYIREFKPKVDKCWGGLVAVVCCLTNPLFKFLDNRYLSFGTGVHGVFGAVLAIVVFLLLYQADSKSAAVKKTLKTISLLSLDMYLCSYIFDAIYYPWFKVRFFVDQSQFGAFFFVIVPLVFASSFVLAYAKEVLFRISGITGWLRRSQVRG